MDRATMEHIFEPFFSTKDAGEGVGLGLSVLHGIVLAHGGGVTVYSEPGIGTIFRIYLPMQPQGGEEAGLKNQPIMTGSERVLFVDDEHAIVNMGKVMLERLGYHVTATTSSEEAFRLLRTTPDDFDVLITDHTMPFMTGDRLAKEALRIRPGLPIVLITGFSEQVTELNYRALGIREFAMKPLLMHDLAETVRRALKPQPEFET
jgi:CheY-like chemotaxis protein